MLKMNAVAPDKPDIIIGWKQDDSKNDHKPFSLIVLQSEE